VLGVQVALLDAGIQPELLPAEGFDRGNCREGALSQLAGTVKLYNAEKGFGFVMADDGQKDVFLHKSCLDHHGLQTLEPGERIVMNVRITPKGRAVVAFVFYGDPSVSPVRVVSTGIAGVARERAIFEVEIIRLTWRQRANI